MIHFFEQLVISIWNYFHRPRVAKEGSGILLGNQVAEEEVTKCRITLSDTRRTMHIAILGKTGSGKSSLLRLMAQQDIESGRGFLYFDLHGDATPFLLKSIANREATSTRKCTKG